MKVLCKKKTVFIIIIVLCVMFNLAGWVIPGFSDYYTDNFFGMLTHPYGRLTSMVHFSVGERLLIVLVLVVAAILIFCAASLICMVFKKDTPGWLKAYRSILAKTLPVLLSFICVIMSLNCFILYHCTPIKAGEVKKDSYTIEELAVLRDYIVGKCNDMAKQVPRDAEGNVIYEKDMAQTARTSMVKLSDIYPRLGGFYVTPKELTFSGFMSQQYMQGYYFPFSMEANINGMMYIMNKPFTMCHELAHTKGFIYEDEANFLGFLGCINSGDLTFEYSGYLGVLAYVNNDFYRSVDREVYDSHIRISDEVRFDDQFLTDKAWEEVEKRAVLDTQTVKSAADTFIDTNLKVNGIPEGKASYSNVVGLLLDYYSNNPYN